MKLRSVASGFSGWYAAGCVVLALGCERMEADPLGSQPSIQAWLVVHVEPLARESGEPCTDPGLGECGSPVAYSWERRSQNLVWLLDNWVEAGRSMDLQLGPEASLTWMDEPELTVALMDSFGTDGDADGVLLNATDAASRVASISRQVRESLSSGLGSERVDLGVHVHTVLPDSSGQWGTAPKGRQADEAGPCDSYVEAPLSEGEASIVERVVEFGVTSAAALAEFGGSDLLSFTGHLPRTMAGKIMVVEDPDSLDPDTDTEFSTRFRPSNLGSAYSECLHRVVDHPPFEPWAADTASALSRGDGPVVIPGERVIGTMDEHLDAWADTAASAAARRFLQLLVNWRVAGLRGDEERPWVYTFHTHLYQLNPGDPGVFDPTARSSSTREGGALRGDLEALANWVDGFGSETQWGGVSSTGGDVVEWIMPSDVRTANSGFDYGAADSPPSTQFDEASYPYLPLIAERLENTHLVCEGVRDGVRVFGFSRCGTDWGWGRPGPGYACADGSAPEGVFLLLPERATCLSVASASMRAGAVTDDELSHPTWCDGNSIEVPIEGLLVEPTSGLMWMSDSCTPWR